MQVALLYVQTWSQNTCKSVNTESGNGKAQGWGGDREKTLNLKAFLDQDSTSTEMATLQKLLHVTRVVPAGSRQPAELTGYLGCLCWLLL